MCEWSEATQLQVSSRLVVSPDPSLHRMPDVLFVFFRETKPRSISLCLPRRPPSSCCFPTRVVSNTSLLHGKWRCLLLVVFCILLWHVFSYFQSLSCVFRMRVASIFYSQTPDMSSIFFFLASFANLSLFRYGLTISKAPVGPSFTSTMTQLGTRWVCVHMWV